MQAFHQHHNFFSRRLAPKLSLRYRTVYLMFFVFLGLSSCTAVHSKPAKTESPSTSTKVLTDFTEAPILRIETGLHTATIMSMAVDKEERFVVTAAIDKTVRIWDIGNGKLLQILRPPIDEGEEGKLYAVAISPLGEQIAVAGWTGYKWDKTASIYIFNRATGELQGRIRNLPSYINHLAYSADGKVLAATLGVTQYDAKGVFFYKPFQNNGQYQELAKDTDYADSSYSIDFDIQGRSVTTSFDGYLRLYDARFNKLLKKKAHGGKQPFFARFSPDGEHIAVGFYDNTAINLFSDHNLTLLKSPKTQRFIQGNLNSVAWSQDGQKLYAGGRYHNGKGNPVISWSTESLSTHQVYPAAQDTVMDIHSLADGGLLFASADPALGRLNAKGQLVWKQGAGKLGYTALRNFKLSDNGETVGFHYQYENQQGEVERKTARWDLANLTFNNNADINNLNSPSLSMPGLNIQYWENKDQPSLNGAKLTLQDDEISRSLAISKSTADQPSFFVLGTEWYIRFFNHQGKQLWHQPVSIAWAVNISADGRYVVAALGDGTIRWYQTEDGKERLAFYLHPDAIMGKPRWIAWTPEGFYATSSQDAEALMGFHLNQGADKAARFVDASQLSEVFARADLVALALDNTYPTLAVKALQQAGDIQTILARGIAPRIHLLSEDNIQLDRREFELEFTLEDRGGGIGKLEYRVNDELMSSDGSRPFAPRQAGGQQGYRRSFTLPQGKHTVSVRAYNKNNQIISKPVEIEVLINDPVYREPSLYVLSVGISRYRDPDFNLKYAADDAIDFATTLKKQGRKLYQRVVTQTLVDQEATLAEIGAAFEAMARKAQPQDVFVFYLAGHGTVSEGRYQFIPYDLIYENEASLRQALNEAKLKELLASVEAGKRMMVIDSCHAGKAIPTLAALSRGSSIEVKAAIVRLMNATGIAVLAAASKEKYALEGIIDENGVGHGLFTHVMLQGLRGAANRDKQDIEIDIEELMSYTRREVPRISLQKFQYEQFPMFLPPKQNFPISLIDQEE